MKLESFEQIVPYKHTISTQKKLIRIDALKQAAGYLGPGHMSRVLMMEDFQKTDPFILFMDDVLERRIAGLHPYAGFETATLVLQGELHNGATRMKSGDFELITADSGIIQSETIDRIVSRRVLKLWLTLPKNERWIAPGIQNFPLKHVPKKYKSGVYIKVYSGSFAGLTSPVKNHVPLVIADIEMAPKVSTIEKIPAHYNSFLYTVRGNIRIGEEKRLLNEEQIGWLNVTNGNIEGELKLTAGEQGCRFIVFAAKPAGENIVAFDSFIGDTEEDIDRLNLEYETGKMRYYTAVPQIQQGDFVNQ